MNDFWDSHVVLALHHNTHSPASPQPTPPYPALPHPAPLHPRRGDWRFYEHFSNEAFLLLSVSITERYYCHHIRTTPTRSSLIHPIVTIYLVLGGNQTLNHRNTHRNAQRNAHRNANGHRDGYYRNYAYYNVVLRLFVCF